LTQSSIVLVLVLVLVIVFAFRSMRHSGFSEFRGSGNGLHLFDLSPIRSVFQSYS
jgi:hypothetical protein